MTPLLEVDGLRVEVDDPDLGFCDAVAGLRLSVDRSEALGLVGESGCGKSLTVLAILGLLPEPSVRLAAGRMRFDGEDVDLRDPAALRPLRGRRIGYVPQDPMSALNPVLSVGEQVSEAVRLQQRLGRRDARLRSEELLAQVGIPAPARRFRAYPHELSGGQRQRVLIAIALAGEPDLLALDEPTTALDVTVQAQVLGMLGQLQRDRALSILFVTHDLAVVAATCHRVSILYAGRCVELGGARAVLGRPMHPYTRGLLDSRPGAGPSAGGRRRLQIIPGSVPGVGSWPSGCPFRDRCPRAEGPCAREEPELRDLGDGRGVACHFPLVGDGA